MGRLRGWGGGPEPDAGSGLQLQGELYLVQSLTFATSNSSPWPWIFSQTMGRDVLHRNGGVEHRRWTGCRVEQKGKRNFFQVILLAESWGIIYKLGDHWWAHVGIWRGQRQVTIWVTKERRARVISPVREAGNTDSIRAGAQQSSRLRSQEKRMDERERELPDLSETHRGVSLVLDHWVAPEH